MMQTGGSANSIPKTNKAQTNSSGLAMQADVPERNKVRASGATNKMPAAIRPIYIGFVLVAILSFALIALPHIEYGLPMHSDEYDNIAIAKEYSSGNFFSGNPYMPDNEKVAIDYGMNAPDFQIGYSLLLAAFSLFGIINPLLLPYYVPWLVAFISSLTGFVFLRKVGLPEFVSFTGALFIFFLPSSQLMLGQFFLVASSAALAILPLLLLIGIGFSEGDIKIELYLIVLAVSAAIYAPITIIAVASLLLYIASYKEMRERNWKNILLLGIFSACLLAMYILFIIFSAGLNPLQLLAEHGISFLFAAANYTFDQLLLGESISGAVPSLHDFMGMPLFIFSMFSALFLFYGWMKNRHEDAAMKKLAIVFLPALFFSALSYVAILIGRGILMPAERLVLFSAFLLLLCAGIFAANIVARLIVLLGNLFAGKARSGQVFIWDTLRGGAELSHAGNGDALHGTILTAIFILLVAGMVLFSSPVKFDSFSLNLQPDEMSGMLWIKENTGENSLILAPPYISKPIKVIAERDVVCTSSTRFGCPPELNYLVSTFFFASCEEKEKMLSGYFNADYVFVPKSLNAKGGEISFPEQQCSFLEKAFDEGNITIYINKSNN